MLLRTLAASQESSTSTSIDVALRRKLIYRLPWTRLRKIGTFVKHRQYDLKTNPGTSKEHHWRHVIPPDIREIFNLLPISIGDTKQNHIMAWLAASGRAHSQSVDYKSWCSILRRSDLTQRDAFNSKCNSFLLLLLHPLEGVFYANWFFVIPIRRCCLPRCDKYNLHNVLPVANVPNST